MSYQSVQSAIVQIKNPSYVPPVDCAELGRKAFFYGLDRQESWPEAMKEGWNAAFDKVADGIAAEDYLAAAAFVDSVVGQ